MHIKYNIQLNTHKAGEPLQSLCRRHAPLGARTDMLRSNTVAASDGGSRNFAEGLRHACPSHGRS